MSSQLNQTLNPNPKPDSKLVITGGVKLSGHVSISGSKNAALPILAATICCSGTTKLDNVPDLSDTRAMASILTSLGAKIEFSNNEVVINTERMGSVEPDPTHIGKIRGGFFVIGPLLARFGEAVVALPGGCDIGARPIDIYIRGLRALGAVVEVRADAKVVAYAANRKCLVGGKFDLDYPSVGATETLIMAACMAEGNTLLTNVAKEPEIIDLACFMQKGGARIEGVGTNEIYIRGTNRLYGTEYGVMADRIEAGSFVLAAAITRSSISMSPVFPGFLASLIEKLTEAGCKITQKHETLEISAEGLDESRGFDIKTNPYPGFPTDLQPQTMSFLSTCNGLSNIEETVFENRMSHVAELQKLGAKIHVSGSRALVHGKDEGENNKLYGTRVDAHDLRGGMALVLAGLAAQGITEIYGISHIERGYENLEMKLQLLGAHVKREFNNI